MGDILTIRNYKVELVLANLSEACAALLHFTETPGDFEEYELEFLQADALNAIAAANQLLGK